MMMIVMALPQPAANILPTAPAHQSHITHMSGPYRTVDISCRPSILPTYYMGYTSCISHTVYICYTTSTDLKIRSYYTSYTVLAYYMSNIECIVRTYITVGTIANGHPLGGCRKWAKCV